MPEKQKDKFVLMTDLLKLQNKLLAEIDTKLKEILEQNSEIIERIGEIYNELHWYVHRLK